MSVGGLMALAVFSCSATAQSSCANVVVPGPATLTGPAGATYAMTKLDPDGPGPLPADLIVGGDFVGDNIARWNPVTGAWSALGAGVPGVVRELVTMPNGNVAAAVGSSSSNYSDGVQLWDGTTWTPLVSSMSGQVNALHAMPNGDLLAGGDFTSIDGVAASSLARWDGSSWSQFAGGLGGSSPRVHAFEQMANGDLVIGGEFVSAGGVSANSIAIWNGQSFAALGTGLQNASSVVTVPTVMDLVTRANGDLFVCGAFQYAGGVTVNSVALWDGSAWSAMGAGLAQPFIHASGVASATELPNGDIVTGGSYLQFIGPTEGRVHRWDGTSWQRLGAFWELLSAVHVVESTVSGIVSGGAVLRQFDGTVWQPINSPGLTTGFIHAACKLPTGELVVAGSFSMVAGVVLNRIGLWDGTSWSNMGGGMNGVVWHMDVAPNGDVIATGMFTSAGGVPANRIARWDGTSWSPLGTGSSVTTVPEFLPNGDVVVSGQFQTIGGVAASNVARWDGSAWSAMGGGLIGGGANALHATPEGIVYAVGLFALPATPAFTSYRLMRWDGTSWTSLEAMGGILYDVTSLPNGDVVVCGSFSGVGGLPIDGVARWSGSAWFPFGSGAYWPRCVEALPNGDVIIGGTFDAAGGVPADHLARWNGSAWAPIGAGADGDVTGSFLAADGNVVVTGSFGVIGGVPSPLVAEISTTCPAAVDPLGNACPSSGGSNELVADSLPWTGSTFGMTASGLPPFTLIAVDGGLAPLGPLPLATIGLPLAPPGCMLHIAPDYFEIGYSTTGQHSFDWAIPNDPMFAGLNVYWQFVVFDMSPGLALLETTSTNALELTIGSF